MTTILPPTPAQEIEARMLLRKDARESVEKWVQIMTHNGLKTYVANTIGDTSPAGTLAVSMRIEEAEARGYKVVGFSQAILNERQDPRFGVVLGLLSSLVLEAPASAGAVLKLTPP
jgi:hypothetical protein